MARKRRVKVIDESDTGRNLRFQDTVTKKQMTTKQFIKAIENDEYTEYHVRKKKDGTKYPASNPDGKIKNNLG